MRPMSIDDEMPFSSAATYFEERPCAIPYPDFTLDHFLIIPSHATRDDLPYPSRLFSRDVSNSDWQTFVNYVLLDHIRASVEKSDANQKKESAPLNEDSPERHERINAVIAEWNEGFFGPRGIRVHPEFASVLSSVSRSTSRPSGPYGGTADSQLEATPAHRQRSHSVSSTSSSSSSSSGSSVDSISSGDFEGAEVTDIRKSIIAFRLDKNGKRNIKKACRQFRDELRSHRHKVPRSLWKQHADEFRSTKREIRGLVREIKTDLKTEKKVRKAEKKNRKAIRKAEKRTMKARRKAERLEFESNARQEKLAKETDMRVRQQTLDAEARGRESEMRARRQAMEAEARGRESESRARRLAMEAEARGVEAGIRGMQRAKEAELRGREAGVRIMRQAGVEENAWRGDRFKGRQEVRVEEVDERRTGMWGGRRGGRGRRSRGGDCEMGTRRYVAWVRENGNESEEQESGVLTRKD